MVYTFSADFQKILSAHIETRDVYESDASIATWTASFDISNLPHDTYFGSPGVEGPLNFSRYNIDDNNGIRTNLKKTLNIGLNIIGNQTKQQQQIR